MLRCPIDVLHEEFNRSGRVRNLFVSYSETLLAQVQQSVACNAVHSTEERMCRWLLMMHDRAEGEPLTYTHEFLANPWRAVVAGGRPDCLSTRHDTGAKSGGARGGGLRMLRPREEAVRRFPLASFLRSAQVDTTMTSPQGLDCLWPLLSPDYLQ